MNLGAWCILFPCFLLGGNARIEPPQSTFHTKPKPRGWPSLLSKATLASILCDEFQQWYSLIVSCPREKTQQKGCPTRQRLRIAAHIQSMVMVCL